MAASKKWTAFPFPSPDYAYEGPALRKAWPRLHRGDCEPWPKGKAQKTLEEAWRAFHRGDFQAAVEQGASLGTPGAVVAGKAAGVWATYLAADERSALAVLEAAIRRAEASIAADPATANHHYFHAFVLGRFSQRISIVQALAQGLGGKVQASLARALELEPKHAEAHTASGLFHAEIVAKVGVLAARLGYGATREQALRHFERALELHRDSPIAHLEYARGLRLLYGKERRKEVRQALETAAALQPADAMERLDQEAARGELRSA